MGHRSRVLTFIGVLFVALAAGALGYNIGLSHGLAATVPAAGVAGAAPYMFYRPWGFGFGFGPLLFLLLFFFLFRMVLWGGVYGRRGRCNGSSRLDEWHRRAHEQMNGQQRSAAPETLG
jgi:hypothetical protein